jgi:threonine/homoserine/homoserine lactone efflux protein
LLYIAATIWRNSAQKLTVDSNQNTAKSFVRGVLVNALNPKSVLFAAAVLIVVFPPNMLFNENAFVVLNHFLVEVVFYSTLACIMSRQTVREKYISLKLYLDRISSVALGGFGLSLLSERYTSS